MKFLILGFFLLPLSVNSFAAPVNPAPFPMGPDAHLTPGSTCSTPDAYRYAEHIPYCNRRVSGRDKDVIFGEYRSIGFVIDISRRSDFKIDHLIPLCAGGSNNPDNLWPQHKSIFAQTDKIESVGCDKLKAGKLKQADLIKMILEAKRNLSLAAPTLTTLNNL
jgi:hypothetical protein